MRLDKYLKVSRIVKRRTIAKEMADNGRVLINDKIAKSSSILEEGDHITILFGNRKVTVMVKALLDSTKKEDAKQMFDILEETRL